MSQPEAKTPTDDSRATLSPDDEKHLEAFMRKYFLRPLEEPWTPTKVEINRLLRSCRKSLKYFAKHYPEAPAASVESVLWRALLEYGVNTYTCLKDENNAKWLARETKRLCRRTPEAQQVNVPVEALRVLLKAVREYPRTFRENPLDRLVHHAQAEVILEFKGDRTLDSNRGPSRAGPARRPKQFSQLPKDEQRLLAGTCARSEAPTIQGYLFHHPALTGEESTILITRYPYGPNRTWPEVAEKVGMPEIKAKRLHASALAKLRKALPQEPDYHI